MAGFIYSDKCTHPFTPYKFTILSLCIVANYKQSIIIMFFI